MRERIQPKMGKIDIDYAILHDAFFKHSKKPKFTQHGDMYFEGRENEIKNHKFKVGRMSPALIEALGINSNQLPPWIANMQRFGPPPAYPNLKIPSVNIALPPSIQQTTDQSANGTGGLFQDENGCTVYADCHGLNKSVYQKRQTQKVYWGELKKDEESSSDEDQEAESSEESQLEAQDDDESS